MALWQRILLYFLPDRSRVKRLWLGWMLPFWIRCALCRGVTSVMSLMLGRWVLTMFWAVSITTSDVCSRDAFHRFSVKFETWHRNVELGSRVFYFLLFFYQGGDVWIGIWVLCDVGSQEADRAECLRLLFFLKSTISSWFCWRWLVARSLCPCNTPPPPPYMNSHHCLWGWCRRCNTQ